MDLSKVKVQAPQQAALTFKFLGRQLPDILPPLAMPPQLGHVIVCQTGTAWKVAQVVHAVTAAGQPVVQFELQEMPRKTDAPVSQPETVQP